ncbi:MAG: hypothetical protein KatS3mg131_0002 [Candidatus Tectimicrobiota bacterium]|nr:MAG: hypothetical protein KatS3mg131_0002 [Candidatus Tectomicrobia bacterium]
MGYIGNFIAIIGLIPLPFAGYWLGREIYEYDQQLGITMMGGIFSWLFIVQAVLIGALFLGANYYLWLGMERIPGAERYRRFTPFLLAILTVCFLIWLTPHSLVASLEEARKMGGAHHPLLGVFGVMSAKNTVVNIMILTTLYSFLLYRRGNKGERLPMAQAAGGSQSPAGHPGRRVHRPAGPAGQPLALAAHRSGRGGPLALLLTFKDRGTWGQVLLFLLSAAIVIFYGVYGYFVEAIVRIGFSVLQVSSVLLVLIMATAIDIVIFRGAPIVGEIRWGQIPERAQYVLFLLATSFTWLMGLMGYARSGLRTPLAHFQRAARLLLGCFYPDAGLCLPGGVGDRAPVFALGELHFLAGAPGNQSARRRGGRAWAGGAGDGAGAGCGWRRGRLGKRRHENVPQGFCLQRGGDRLFPLRGQQHSAAAQGSAKGAGAVARLVAGGLHPGGAGALFRQGHLRLVPSHWGKG